MMGIMVPPKHVERTISFCNKEPSVASSWPFYFRVLTTMHGENRIKVIRVIETRTIRWRWYVACVREKDENMLDSGEVN
jgi:hypothetical protein